MRRLIIGLALVCIASAPAAADDPLLKQLVGDWVGRGTVRWKTSGDPEQLYCKISGALSPGGGGLHQQGRCALPANSAAFQVDLQALGADRYRGSANRPGGATLATLSGIGETNRLIMTAETSATMTTSTANIDIVTGGFAVKAMWVDPTTNGYMVCEVVFSPQ